MPFVAAFVSAEAAAAAVTAAEIAAAAETAQLAAAAAETATAAQTAQAASATQAGIMGAQATGAGATGSGIMGAQAAPAIEAATAVGGQGAGDIAVQTAMQEGMMSAPTSTLEPQAIQSYNMAPGIEAPPPPAASSYQGPTTADLEAVNQPQGIKSRGITSMPQSGTPTAVSSPQGVTSAPETVGADKARMQLVDLDSWRVSDTPLPTSSTPVDPYQPAQLPPGAAPEAGRQVAGATPSTMDKAMAFAKENPYLTGAAAYTAAYNLGMLDPRGTEMPAKKSYSSQYTLSKDFRGSEATPDVYQPSYKTYAEGGVMTVGGASSEVPEPRKVNNPMATISSMAEGGIPGYAKGGSLSSSLDFYKQMMEGQPRKASLDKGDVGIYYDQDPDTRYQDALTAAQIRQAKVNKRANLQMPSGGVMKRPTPMGQLNLAPPGAKKQDYDGATEAARGGIMQAGSSLGGYAAGGNPRLLKGPGDGMSDDIPAMIGKKQPARLADGEFVIPADVVSHLGNGSTEAGAKRLHEMMNKVRRARTGNPKQGKQINPSKYMPK